MERATPMTRVAVIDDDDGICRSLSRLLSASQIQAVSYRSAEDFLHDGDSSRFDCLILDIQLDGMSGMDLNEKLKSNGVTTPVIFLTAHDDPKFRERALRCGCAGFLRKSCPGDTLLAAIRHAAGRE